MNRRFRLYLDRKFSSLPNTTAVKDVEEELMTALLDRAQECRDRGMAEDEIYKYCIDSLGDISETIKTLKITPLDLLKDTKFKRATMFTLLYAMIVLVVYLAVSFITLAWSGTWIILVGAIGIYLVGLLGSLIAPCIELKRPIYLSVVFTFLIFVLTLIVYFSVVLITKNWSKTWLIWTTMPTIMLTGVLAAYGLTKRKILFGLIQIIIIVGSVSVFLLVSVLVPSIGFRMGWLFILVGIIIAMGLAIGRLNR